MSKVGVQKKDIKEEGGWPYWPPEGGRGQICTHSFQTESCLLGTCHKHINAVIFFLKKRLRGRHCKDYILNSFILKPLVDTEFLSPDVQLKLNHCYH